MYTIFSNVFQCISCIFDFSKYTLYKVFTLYAYLLYMYIISIEITFYEYSYNSMLYRMYSRIFFIEFFTSCNCLKNVVQLFLHPQNHRFESIIIYFCIAPNSRRSRHWTLPGVGSATCLARHWTLPGVGSATCLGLAMTFCL